MDYRKGFGRAVFYAIVLCNSFTLQGQEEVPSITLTSLTELKVALSDEDGHPVVGAQVMPYAMRVEEVNGHGFWNRAVLGSPKTHASDSMGIATIKYPAKIDSRPKPFTTKLVTFMIQHSDYVQKVVHHSLDPDNPAAIAEVTLETGCELQLSAVDDAGQPVTDFAVMLAGPFAARIWANDGEGGRRTRALSDGTWQTMLVSPGEDGIPLFSGLLPLRVRPEQAMRIRNVKLSQGSRVLGGIDASVPRPITNGYVMATIAPSPQGDSYDKESPSLTWHTTADIQANGNFVMPSIPRAGKMQIIAVCDGWVSKTTMEEARSFVMGQLFDVQEELTDVTVAMERTGTLELSISLPDGRPLDSGSVSSWPNQAYYKGGSTFLGQRYNSIDEVMLQLDPDGNQTAGREYPDLPFSNQPVRNGIATLKGIPIGKREQVVLLHEDFRFAGAGQRGEIEFQLESHKPQKLEAETVPFESAAK